MRVLRFFLFATAAVVAVSCAARETMPVHDHDQDHDHDHAVVTRHEPEPMWQLGTAVATSADLAIVRQHLPPGGGSAKTSDMTKDVQLLQGGDFETFALAMHGFANALGKDCLHCHVEKKFDAETDKKKLARTMIVMADDLNRTTFGGKTKVTCWTCHAGSPKPEKVPADMDARIAKATPPMFKIAPADADKPAKEVFKNLQLLGNVPAGQIPYFMGFFSASLGKDCAFCHVKDDPASDDKKEKRFARDMMRMSLRASAAIDGTRGSLTCWTCHRGEEHPAKKPGPVE